MGKTREWNEKYLERHIEIYRDIKRHREASTSIEIYERGIAVALEKTLGGERQKNMRKTELIGVQ